MKCLWLLHISKIIPCEEMCARCELEKLQHVVFFCVQYSPQTFDWTSNAHLQRWKKTSLCGAVALFLKEKLGYFNFIPNHLKNHTYGRHFFYVFIQFFNILMVTGFRFVQCDDNRWYRIYNYAYLDYLPSPLASWSWVEA